MGRTIGIGLWSGDRGRFSELLRDQLRVLCQFWEHEHAIAVPIKAYNHGLVPMLDDSIRRVDYSAIHVEEYTSESMSFWRSREIRALLKEGHVGSEGKS